MSINSSQRGVFIAKTVLYQPFEEVFWRRSFGGKERPEALPQEMPGTGNSG